MEGFGADQLLLFIETALSTPLAPFHHASLPFRLFNLFLFLLLFPFRPSAIHWERLHHSSTPCACVIHFGAGLFSRGTCTHLYVRIDLTKMMELHGPEPGIGHQRKPYEVYSLPMTFAPQHVSVVARAPVTFVGERG